MAIGINVPRGQRLYQESSAADRIYFLKDSALNKLNRANDNFKRPVSVYRFAGDHQGIITLQNFAGQRNSEPAGKQAKWVLKKR